MLILSRVCADFRDSRGQVIFRIPPESRLTGVWIPGVRTSNSLTTFSASSRGLFRSSIGPLPF